MISLFILPTCPYCRKVLNYLDTTDLKYNILNIDEKANYDEMMRLGGKRQVPFLVDKDRSVQMYESSDIVEYLKTVI